jgi:hypothetical protein
MNHRVFSKGLASILYPCLNSVMCARASVNSSLVINSAIMFSYHPRPWILIRDTCFFIERINSLYTLLYKTFLN